jgi:putative redox protein
MVTCENEEPRYRVVISNGKHEIPSDTIPNHGGEGSAIRPHELLEGALAACLNMTVRMHADKRGIPVTKVTTKVLADRTQPGKTIFQYSFSIAGALTNEQREELNRVAESCPVRKTLSNQIEFVSRSE